MPRCSNLSPPLAVALATAALLGSSGVARAQEPPPVYQTQKASSRSFHLDGVTRQEWTDDETFSARSRRMIRMKPRVEAGAKWFQIGVGGDFIYSSDENLGPLGGINQALLRDNYVSRDARLDLAWAKLSPVKYVSAQGGRFIMPVRFTEMIWDRDLRPQGGSASIDFTSSTSGIRHFGLTGIYARGSHVLPQEGAFKFENRDTIWIGSATVTFSAGAHDSLELLGSYLKFEDLRFVALPLRRQNTRVAGVLTKPYEVVDLVARYHGEGHMSTTLVADYCWNTAVSNDNHGLWLAIVFGSTTTARGSLEYTYAQVDKDATLAAYTTDDFLWGTGWAGHRVDLGFHMSDRASSHLIGQLQKFKDSPNLIDRDNYIKRFRIEIRLSY